MSDTQKPPLDDLYTVGDVASASRFDRKTIYRMCAEGVIPHMRIGGGQGRGGDIRFTAGQWREFQEMYTVQPVGPGEPK